MPGATDTMAPGGEVAGSRAIARADARRGALLVVEGGIILALAWAFHVESPAFYRIVLPLAFGGALLHHWLPIGYRPLFFGALSIVGILVVLGVSAGAWLVGVGLALMGLCHVPVPFRWRVALVAAAGAVLVAMRSTWLPAPWPGVIWPILGSMFMFRLAVYLYDLKHRGPSGLGFVLSYFFLLPNVVFLLFPVIDFHTFRRTYYDRKALDIYEEGVRWIFRGLTHLVLYRVVYEHVAVSPAEVVSTAGITRYLVGNYGLYLRVSGQFHVIVGLLHLFGFRLPETHRFYYLASSFSDLWRRVNIYWKDFMQKMVYLPAIFGLKRRGETTALVGATAAVIVVTWFLHSYQWFWLLGTWLFSATDVVFWGILGTLLMANTLREQRRGRSRQVTSRVPTNRRAWWDAWQTAGMFALMCLLFGFWTSPSFGDFRALLGAGTLRGLDVAVLVGTLGAVAGAAFVARRLSLGLPADMAVRRWWQHPLVNAALPLALLWAVGEPRLSARLPAAAQAVAREARTVELNKYDAERLQRGYYEKIVGINRFNGELWEVYARAGNDAQQPEIAPDEEADRAGATWPGRLPTRPAKGGPGNELIPLASTVFKGGRFSTNRWGMRDRDYELAPPPTVRRIAVLGQSYVMGSGVNDGEPFEALVEDRLNREWSKKTGLRYESLNFAISSHSFAQQAIILKNGRVSRFRPDVVLLVGNPNDFRTLMRFVFRVVRRGGRVPEAVEQMVREAGVAKDMSELEAMRRLMPYEDELARWALADVASEADRMGALAVFALIPIPHDKVPPRSKARLLSIVRESGFMIIDMADVFEGFDAASLQLNAADRHPNAEGHRIMATRLYAELTNVPEIVSAPSQVRTARSRAAEWKTSHARATAEAFTDPWRVDSHEGSVATLAHSATRPGAMRVSISKLTQQVPWHVQLLRVSPEIVAGHRYRLSFQARADSPRSIVCAASQNTTPWQPIGLFRRLDVTGDWQVFEFSFEATASEPSARIHFNLGGSDVAVELSDVVLRNLTTRRTMAPDALPTARESTTWQASRQDQ